MARNARIVISLVLLAGLVGGGVWALQRTDNPGAETAVEADAHAVPVRADQFAPVRVSRQARANLGLKSKPIELTNFWRTIELPGVIVDRPGVSDRGVITPVTGIVTSIEAFPGDTVQPGAAIFTIRLVSESLHASQLELYKATREIEIARDQLQRLSSVAESGALPRSRIIDIENEIKRLNVTVEAYRQDLQARGLPSEAIVAAAKGEFVTEIAVRAPNEAAVRDRNVSGQDGVEGFTFEVQSLEVELGEQVQSGQVLAELADHRALFIEGRAFKDDVSLIQRAAKNGWEVEIDFGLDEERGDWPPAPSRLQIHHVANLVDPETNTFAFYLALENQWQTYTREGVARSLWRFRPGGRVRLRVPVEELNDVFVVPRAAVAEEGPEAFVFRQNGDYFDRRPVRVLHEDRLYAVLANDNSVSPGFYIAQNSAASLNRIQKAQSSSGAPNVHVHADGTVHAAH